MKPIDITALIVAQLNCPVELAVPINIKGAPRIGKSGCVKTACKQAGARLFDVRLSTIQDVDISGLPHFWTDADGRTFSEFAWPAVFPKPGCGPTVLLFDELDKGLPSTMNAALGVIYDRQIHGHRLPDSVRLVACSNRTTDKAHSQRLGNAMSPRWTNVDFEFDLNNFLGWWLENNLPAEIPAFLKFRHHLLSTATGAKEKGFAYEFDATSEEDSFPAPATWEYVARLMQQGLPTKIFDELVRKTVGNAAAIEFLAFLKIAKSLPSIEEIRYAPMTATLPEEPSARYAAAGMLARRMTPATAPQFVQYLDRLGKAFSAYGVSAAGQRDGSLWQEQALQQWSHRNQKIVFA